MAINWQTANLATLLKVPMLRFCDHSFFNSPRMEEKCKEASLRLPKSFRCWSAWSRRRDHRAESCFNSMMDWATSCGETLVKETPHPILSTASASSPSGPTSMGNPAPKKIVGLGRESFFHGRQFPKETEPEVTGRQLLGQII